MKLFKYQIFLFLVTLLLGATEFIHAQSHEDLLKAGILEKFANYTEWPKQSFNNDDCFSIVVMEDFGVYQALKQLYGNGNIKKLPVKLSYLERNDSVPMCHMLFLSKSLDEVMYKCLLKVNEKPILTISDSEVLIDSGGLIYIYITENRTFHFAINHNKVKRYGLKMDFLLLKLAKLVG